MNLSQEPSRHRVQVSRSGLLRVRLVRYEFNLPRRLRRSIRGVTIMEPFDRRTMSLSSPHQPKSTTTLRLGDQNHAVSIPLISAAVEVCREERYFASASSSNFHTTSLGLLAFLTVTVPLRSSPATSPPEGENAILSQRLKTGHLLKMRRYPVRECMRHGGAQPAQQAPKPPNGRPRTLGRCYVNVLGRPRLVAKVPNGHNLLV